MKAVFRVNYSNELIRRLDEVLAQVRTEVLAASEVHSEFHSYHEAYGVIAEEFNKEFLDAIHGNDHKQARRELVQVGAMAVRALVDLP